MFRRTDEPHKKPKEFHIIRQVDNGGGTSLAKTTVNQYTARADIIENGTHQKCKNPSKPTKTPYARTIDSNCEQSVNRKESRQQ